MAARLPTLLACLLVVLGGCEDDVDPTLGTDQTFSLYGYLDPTADRQAIRVVPITATLGADTTDVIDAVVTSVEPATGRTAAWRDSLATFADGSRGHIFVADYTPTPGTRVDLAVRASDGREATVSVEIPPLARAEVGAPTASLTGSTYPVTVRGVPRVIGGTLRVYVTGLPAAPEETSVIEIPIRRLNIEQEGAAWRVDVPFLGAVRDHLQELGLFNRGLMLVEAEFSSFVANEAWARPPDGFDEDAIVEPGTFSNVAGGFGFVGAGYRSPVRWLPSTNVQSQAGFAVNNDPAADIAINEIGDGYVEFYNPTLEALDLTGYLVTVAGPDAGVRIPPPAGILPGDYLVVQVPFGATANTTVQFLTGSGRLLSGMFVETSVPAWGAYPDGYSYQIPRGGPNLFHGPLVASPGRTNRPAVVPAVINEVSASGIGFVEVAAVGSFATATLSSSPEGLVNDPVAATGSRPFLVATEGGGLELDQIGGIVFLLIETQVVDARFYEAQAPGRSAGYLPDGPDGAWTPDLRPTRGAANRTARFGL